MLTESVERMARLPGKVLLSLMFVLTYVVVAALSLMSLLCPLDLTLSPALASGTSEALLPHQLDPHQLEEAPAAEAVVAAAAPAAVLIRLRLVPRPGAIL